MDNCAEVKRSKKARPPNDLAFKLKLSADGQLGRRNYLEYPRVALVLVLVVAVSLR